MNGVKLSKTVAEETLADNSYSMPAISELEEEKIFKSEGQQ